MLIPIILMAQTLFLQHPNGTVYQAVNDIPDGACILTGAEELVFEVTNFNTCNEIVLQPGCYRAELRGGIGQRGEWCLDTTEFINIQTASALFSLTETTTIYALRGGDGNPGKIVTDSIYAAAPGGGASGVDTILVAGEHVWRATGGPGSSCTTHKYSNLNHINMYFNVGMGLGGNSVTKSYINQGAGFQTGDGAISRACGGGGGGAPDGLGGDIQKMHPLLNPGIIIETGANGTSDGGGDGGDIVSCANAECSELITLHGGTGGKNAYYSCGGQTAVSYGGGGGGAGGFVTNSNKRYLDGGDGGSGSTGTSNTSFLRIYKM